MSLWVATIDSDGCSSWLTVRVAVMLVVAPRCISSSTVVCWSQSMHMPITQVAAASKCTHTHAAADTHAAARTHAPATQHTRAAAAQHTRVQQQQAHMHTRASCELPKILQIRHRQRESSTGKGSSELQGCSGGSIVIREADGRRCGF